MQKEIDAQIAITAAFGQQASKAIGDFAAQKMKERDSLLLQARIATGDEKTRLEQEAKALNDNWGDYGTLRLLAHTVVGGLTGGANGALGAAAGTLAAPTIADALGDAGITGPLASTLTALASTAAGALAGGSLIGGATAFNEVTNNYLNHAQWEKLAKDLEACKKTNTCDKVISDARALNDANDARLIATCADPSSASCVVLSSEARAARDDQIKLGIGTDVLGANANGRSDLIVGKVLSAQNLAASRQRCNDNPSQCITELQGLGVFGLGVVKGIPNIIPSTLNIPSTILDGYINMYQAAAGENLTQLPKLSPFVDCASGLQSAGCVAGEIVGGVVVGTAVVAGLKGTGIVKTAGALEEGAAGSGARGLTDDMLAEADFAARIPTRADLQNHLINAQISGKQISGGHNLVNFEATLQGAGQIVSKIEIAPGVYEIEYKLANKNYLTNGVEVLPKKTVYDPAVYSDSKMSSMATEAAARAQIQFQVTGVKDQFVKVGDIWFFAPVRVEEATGKVLGTRTVFPARPKG